MRFTELALPGVFLVQQERSIDGRGWFARTFCRREFAARNLASEFVQSSLSFNASKLTLRGMHWSVGPESETKLVTCQRGAIFDALVDLRDSSPTHRTWVAHTLTQDSGDALYVPPGVAHGFLTLEADSVVQYSIT